VLLVLVLLVRRPAVMRSANRALLRCHSPPTVKQDAYRVSPDTPRACYLLGASASPSTRR